MTRIRKFAHRDPLSRIYPVNVAQLPRLNQDVDLIYTDGKSDSIWSPGSDGSRGFVVRVWVSPAKRLLEGVIAIDLKQCMVGSIGFSAMSPGLYGELRRPTYDIIRFRRAVFETVAHEYFHLIQGWILITRTQDQDALNKAYVAEMRHHEKKLLADDVRWFFKPEQLSTAAYLRNRFESSARQMAEAALKRLRDEIDRGMWDSIFPLTEMQAMISYGNARR